MFEVFFVLGPKKRKTLTDKQTQYVFIAVFFFFSSRATYSVISNNLWIPVKHNPFCKEKVGEIC